MFDLFDFQIFKNVEKGNKNKIIFSNFTKIIVWFFGILYLLVAVLGISISLSLHNYLSIIKYCLLILFDILSLVMISIKRKETEIVAIFTIIIFILLNFTTTLF